MRLSSSVSSQPLLEERARKMSQCVPSWDLDENRHRPLAKASLRPHSNSSVPDVPMLDYEVAELTWENGQLAMHGFGQRRVPVKPIASTSPSKYTWDKPPTSGTLESIVNQATRLPQRKPPLDGGGSDDEPVPWFDHHREAAASSATMTMDALVPCSNRTEEHTAQVMDSMTALGTGVVGSSARVGSCSGPAATRDEEAFPNGKRPMLAPVPVAPEWSGRDQSVSCSATFGRDSQRLTTDTCERDVGMGFTSTSFGSPENTSSGEPCTKTATVEENDSVCHSRPQSEAGEQREGKKKGQNGKSSVSTKRSRAAAIHNQSERKRRDKINQRMKTLQKLVPNSSKTDKASMLDEVIEYLKQLQAQVQMMNRMNVQTMMLPLAMQQQLQMSMMAAPMSMGMGMGMGIGVLDMNTIGRPNITSGISPILRPTAFMPMASWDGSTDRLQAASATVMTDPLSAFLACQSQPMTMDAYSRMAAMYQQLHQQQPQASSSKI